MKIWNFCPDTEEASESEIAKGDEEYTEIKEQWVLKNETKSFDSYLVRTQCI